MAPFCGCADMYQRLSGAPSTIDTMKTRRYNKAMGTVYKRGKIWWIRYEDKDGRLQSESSGSTKKRDAAGLLLKREGQSEEGKPSGKQTDRITFDVLSTDLLADYKINKKRSTDRAELSVSHLKEFFHGIRATDISTAKINEYIIKRQEEKAANATINRELSALKRMFSLGFRHTPPRVTYVPYIPHLDEDNVRTGFFEHDQYLKLKAALPDYLKPVLVMGYYTAMRRGEILKLTRDQVDTVRGRITLEVKDVKNKTPRIIYMAGELLEEISKQMMLNEAKYPNINLVFHRNGEPIVNPREAWHKACVTAGVPEKLIHDLRRTGARNMLRAGVQEKVIMKIAGWKTRSVFDRYNIVDEKDLQSAATKLVEFTQEVEKNLKGG